MSFLEGRIAGTEWDMPFLAAFYTTDETGSAAEEWITIETYCGILPNVW